MIGIIIFVGFLFCIGFLRMMFHEAQDVHGSGDYIKTMYDHLSRTSMYPYEYERIVATHKPTGLKKNLGIWVSRRYYRQEQLNERADIAWEIWPDPEDEVSRLYYWKTGSLDEAPTLKMLERQGRI